jgi:hypothetical protein
MKRAWFTIVLIPLLVVGCVQRLNRTLTVPGVETVDRKAPFLKVHMRDGSLYLLSPWIANEAERRVSGTGSHFAPDRQVLNQGELSVSLDSVALFETNVARPSPSVAALGVITGITAAAAVFCITNPKACFGSCPTFYVTDGTQEILQAEGFSASVAPSLEARDIDALFRARPQGREVRVQMVNEAYETHVVRYANVLAVPRAEGRRVFVDDVGTFWSVTEPVIPKQCSAPEGDCTAKLAAFDGQERWSKADATDLATRETIDVTFDGPSESPALVLASRQSLLPTYLLYQAFAYLGRSAGQWLAALERADTSTARRANGLVARLGGIDVLVPNGNGGWDSIATIRETGPLAADVRLVRLPRTNGPVRARLRMAKGAWRLDAVGLTSLENQVTPQRLEPADVRLADDTPAPDARAKLLSPTEALVTFPGDRYTLVYSLPDEAQHYELFLETKGYYLEWMRNEWFAEENQMRAASLFLDPAGSLRRLAPEFKRVEPGLEAAFWRSKYAGF